jgi:hypothetical protein
LRNSDQPDVFAWKPPLEQVDNRALVPATVLLPLTGADSTEALNAALDGAHLENAYALIAYDPNLPDPTRLGALLQLGERYTKAKDVHKAASCYQSAALLATLSPALSDQARLDTYLQASAGLRGIAATDAARWVTDQAYLVAQYSPTLRREMRVRRLEQVASAYAALGASGLAAQARAKSAEASSAAETAVAPARTPFAPTVGILPGTPEVDATKQTRIAAAKQLLDDLKNSPPKSTADLPQDSVSQLNDALLKEDSARQTYYDNQLAAAKDPAAQIALLRDKVNWLALKYRTAHGAFGVDLVPEWSKDLIADAWGEAWSDLSRLYEAQAGTLPKPQDANQATEDVVRLELIAARWGWLSGVPEQELHGSLKDVTQKLIDASVSALRLDALTRNGKTAFLLVPDELYGKGEKALPK